MDGSYLCDYQVPITYLSLVLETVLLCGLAWTRTHNTPGFAFHMLGLQIYLHDRPRLCISTQYNTHFFLTSKEILSVLPDEETQLQLLKLCVEAHARHPTTLEAERQASGVQSPDCMRAFKKKIQIMPIKPHKQT